MAEKQNTKGWKKGIYPSDEYLSKSIRNGELYVLDADEGYFACVIVNNTYNESYNGCPWKTKGAFCIVTPLWCGYGYNIEVGENFFANHNTVILDGAKVTFGYNVFIAPDCGFYTAGHPIDYERRNQGLEYAYPITVGDNVWISSGVQVMPGIIIGSNVVTGGGSVVVKDIPDNSVAVGNPCKVVRTITEEDKRTCWDR